MATGKRFYWLKLKVDFLNSEVIDYILSQKNGSDYLAIYLILCTKTINTQGELVNQLGEVIIPYDAEKIQRDCKHFHIDTIRIAMELFSKLNLIYMQENGILKITGYEEMVGSATDYAKQKSLQRKSVDKDVDKDVDNVHIEIRDKEIKRLDIKDNNIKEETKNKYFDNDEVNNIFLDFLKLRKKIKAQNTDRAINLLLKKLGTLTDEEKIEVIDKSIVNSWKDLYLPKQKENKIVPGIELL